MVRDKGLVRATPLLARKFRCHLGIRLRDLQSSRNNFINFCAGKTITNGLQVKTGSCNPTPMGDLPSVDNMVGSHLSPQEFDLMCRL
jgi:hypothetical protein